MAEAQAPAQAWHVRAQIPQGNSHMSRAWMVAGAVPRRGMASGEPVRRAGREPGPVTSPALLLRAMAGPAAGQCPPAPAAGLNRGSGWLASTGPALLLLQRGHGNRYVQRAVGQDPGYDVSGSLRNAIEARRAGGQPLDSEANAQLSQALGTDFRHVRVHADQAADGLSRSLNADAFTVGSHIFFRASRYKPGTTEGRRLLAHELTHVVQQSAGIRSASRLRIAPANDAREHEADRAAGTAASGISGTSGTSGISGMSAPAIQRKVYVGKTKPKQLLQGQDEGQGERSVAKMIADKPSRYFRDEQELYAYARAETETIGYVEKQKAWMRINDRELLVLGEEHTKTTLLDVVRAVGTKRWMYEKYSELPLWVFQGQAGLEALGPGRSRLAQEMTAKYREGSGHEAEGLIPKLWRALAGFRFKTSPAEDIQYVGEKEWRLFQHAIFAAAAAKEFFPYLYKAYAANQKTLELALTVKYGDLRKWGEQAGWNEVVKSVQDMQGAVKFHTTEITEAHPLHKLFLKGWLAPEDDYPDPEMRQADKARDLSMYQHILRRARDISCMDLASSICGG
jgi:hypothetical protein